jgi:Protein of unknown function (DUF4232)
MHLRSQTRQITVWVTFAAASLIPLAATSAAATPTGTGSAAMVRQCGKAALEVWLGDKGEAQLGHYLYPLEVTNLSHSTCQTPGFAAISAYSVADALATGGHQIGRAAKPTGAPRLVTLRPGATAHEWLDLMDVADFTQAECHQVIAPALRILPSGPNSAEVSFSFRACSLRKLTYMFIGPLQPGIGVPPSYAA